MGYGKISGRDSEKTHVPAGKISVGEMPAPPSRAAARSHRRVSPETKREELPWRCGSRRRDDDASNAAAGGHCGELRLGSDAPDAVAKSFDSRPAGRFRWNRQAPSPANGVSPPSDEYPGAPR